MYNNLGNWTVYQRSICKKGKTAFAGVDINTINYATMYTTKIKAEFSFCK